MDHSHEASFRWFNDLHWMLCATLILIFVIKYTAQNTSVRFPTIHVAVISLETKNFK